MTGARPRRIGEARPSHNAVIAFWKSGTGEAVRILDRNLGKSANISRDSADVDSPTITEWARFRVNDRNGRFELMRTGRAPR
jgi:hypothetical protein